MSADRAHQARGGTAAGQGGASGPESDIAFLSTRKIESFRQVSFPDQCAATSSPLALAQLGPGCNGYAPCRSSATDAALRHASADHVACERKHLDKSFARVWIRVHVQKL